MKYTHIATATIGKRYRGTFSMKGAMAIKLVPNVYIVGATALGTDNATSMTKNLPNPPAGDNTADIKSPTFSWPADHAGTVAAEAANAAPKN